MGIAEKQHAIRRSTRLPLEIPLLVTSLDPNFEFSEQCMTTLVNAHGCGVIAPHALPRGIRVRLEMVSAKRYTTAQIAEVVALGDDPPSWLLGLELDVPGNFWGIEYAPSDWKVEQSAPPAEVAQHAAGKTSAAKPASRRWRLTDISGGACYLETGTPFPEGTPVLLSIRASYSECLLDGVVRICHSQAGMGIEFTRVEQHGRVEELIGRLMGNRDVPRIFVGRKEGQQKEEPRPARTAKTTVSEPPDPLLTLIREGTSLSREQFLNDLRKQRQKQS